MKEGRTKNVVLRRNVVLEERDEVVTLGASSRPGLGDHVLVHGFGGGQRSDPVLSSQRDGDVLSEKRRISP